MDEKTRAELRAAFERMLEVSEEGGGIGVTSKVKLPPDADGRVMMFELKLDTWWTR